MRELIRFERSLSTPATVCPRPAKRGEDKGEGPRPASVAAALLLSFFAVAGCRDKRAPTERNFARGLNDYLAVQGDLCLGLEKDRWPIDVWPGSWAAHDRNALQMPVLQKLGLVSASDATVESPSGAPTRVPVHRYQLTDAGRAATRTRPGLAGNPGIEDLCVAKLTLDTVKSWKVVDRGAGPKSAIVHYTYHADPVPWINDPDARRVFPMVDRVIRGAGSAELEEGFTLTAEGWVANELVPPAPPVARAP